ncbi:SDR family NAD(P)-dependent oxidoreductase [Streptomyces roseoverticillatus]|uniref:SDR family NAD(P)-dependent oxidoreductase n=1 Tax=Streptomyces roseoverticillatus TaxID=66429 RepID=UPI001F41D54B|nr:SDR family NAD(P)-dependent oxidoreductase [Streptomyces roseoverticillatus]MCF3101770.1 SDR family NAD(P)-dependent oxidoreductase [Streptomyces roseoverticillatus]
MKALDGLTCTVVVRGTDPVLRDHRVHGTRILPGVSFLDMIYRILRARGVDTDRAELRRVLFRNPVAAGPEFDTELRIAFTADGDGYRVSVTGTRRPSGEAEPVLDCRLHLDVPFPEESVDLAALRRAPHTADMADLYALVRGTGIEHGDFMMARGSLHVGDGELLADLSLSPQAAAYADYFHLHPAALDSSTLLPTQFAVGAVGTAARPYIPMLIESFRARGPVGASTLVHAVPPRPAGPDGDLTTCDLRFLDTDGGVLLWFRGLTSKRVRDEAAITRLDGTPAAARQTAETVVRELLAERLDRADFDEEAGFYELGLDSTALLGISADLERAYGTDFSPTLLFEHNTFAGLVDHLRDLPLPATTAPAAVMRPVVAATAPPEEHPSEVVWFEPRWRPAPLPSAQAAPAPVLTVDATTSRDWPALLAATDASDVLWTPADPQDVEGEAVDLTGFAAALLRSRKQHVRIVCHLPADAPAATAAAIAGLFRTLRIEQPGVRAAVVRTPHADDALAELAAGAPDADVRYEAGERRVREVRPVPAPDAPASLRERGVYLITGGLGGVGLALARHLARTVRARLVLCGRTAAESPVTAELTALGAEVAVIAADVSRPEDVRAAIDHALSRFGTLHGVVHAAGVLRDGLIAGKSADDVRTVLAPKAAGTRHLYETTRHLHLDFLVLCSSTAAAWGNRGQADYACANGFLDGFAEDRPGVVSIGWPGWADGGMQLDAGALRSMGLTAMDTPTAVDIMLRAAGSGRPHAVALVGDAARITEQFTPEEPEAKPGPVAPEPERVASEPKSVDPEPVAPAPIAAEAALAPVLPAGDPDDDAIAIVGISGRYPQARTVDEFWTNLRDGRDSITEVPAGRWDHDAIHTDAKGVPGRSYGKWGGFVDGVDEFDAAFFHISPNEAAVLDPQERLFLQEAWHAFEEAGHAPSSWRGRAVGVFAGVMYNQYQLHGVRAEPGLVPSSFSASIANRVSFFLDLKGPSIALDTMCSSSLTAIHLAVEAIRRGECEAALAGGVNLHVHPNKYLLLSQSSFLSTDGRCRAFGEGGDGYVPGEGVGVVLLRPLRDALRDGDHVHAVIRGTMLNHGGHTGGFSVPSPVSQAALVEHSLAASGVDPADVGYVEAHGTGTSLGDPIEITALERAFDRAGAGRGPWPIGSVKSNVGHLESAAGIAAVTKVLLQMRHRELVPSLHAEPLNPAVDWAGSRFRVQRATEPWIPREGAPLTAAISSFGAGGANAHVVLAERPAPEAAPEAARPRLFVLSAKDADRLDELVAELLAHLERAGGSGSGAALDKLLAEAVGFPADPREPLAELGLDYPRLAALAQRIEEVFGVRLPVDGGTTPADLADRLAATAPPVDLAALAFTLWAGRDHLDERLAVVATTTAELAEALRTGEGCHRGRRRRAAAPAAGDDLQALARAWAGGAEITVPAPAQPRRLSLPGYPFARDRHWVDTAPAGTTGPAALAELVELPDRHVFATRVSKADQPWLSDHTVDGTVLVPGTYFVDLALHAGARLGAPRIAELVTHTPLPAAEAELRLVVSPPSADGRRAFDIHSRAAADTAWTGHVTGTLAPAPEAAPETQPLPGDAEELDVTRLYETLSGYGPGFQGLRRAWRTADAVYADVVVPHGDAGPHGLHPVLLDAALHTVALASTLDGDRPYLPFAWSGVRVHAPGATAARVRVAHLRADTVEVRLTDHSGAPVATVDSVVLRQAGAPADPLHRIEWVPVDAPAPHPHARYAVVGPDPDGAATALEASGAEVTRTPELAALTDVPPVVVLPVVSGGPTAADARALTGRVLGLLQEWLAGDRFADSRLVLVTTRPDPATAAAWGLAGSAQSEHPGRFTLVEADDLAALPRALATDEPRLSLSEGLIRGARLVRTPVTAPAAEPRRHGTVLVTGASGALAAPVVRHLVERHGVSDVLLVSRSGRLPAGLDGLDALGARVESAACDVADRTALAALLTGRQVTMAVHAAGVLDDGVVTALDAERLERVLRPKADGAANLHELLPDAELVLFSSVAGVLGGPGQGNYAAANAFLDALARDRARTGRKAVSVAWGPWAVEDGMAADRDRLTRGGIEALPADAALRLLDAALDGEHPVVTAVRLVPGPAAAAVPHMLRELVAPAPASAAPAPEADAGLAGLGPDERRARLSALVRQHAAAVLGYAGAAAIDSDRSFQELGFDSLSSIEFRNRLGAALGLSLEATLVFDHPTPADLVAHLDERFAGESGASDLQGLLEAFDRIAAALTAAAAGDPDRGRAADRVRGLLDRLAPRTAPAPAGPVADTATDDEIFNLIDTELGTPLPGLEDHTR